MTRRLVRAVRRAGGAATGRPGARREVADLGVTAGTEEVGDRVRRRGTDADAGGVVVTAIFAETVAMGAATAAAAAAGGGTFATTSARAAARQNRLLRRNLARDNPLALDEPAARISPRSSSRS